MDERRPEPRSDAELIAESCSGSAEALEALLVRHLPGLRAFVRLRLGPALRVLESESDLVQSVCADVLPDLGTIEYRGEAEFRNWLYTAVLNKIRNRQRHYLAQKRRPDGGVRALDGDDVWVNSYAALCSPSHHAIVREQVALLERTFDRLPEHYRDVLTLAKIVGLPHEAIAERMGRTVPATRNLLVRAMSRLAGEMARLERE